MVVLGNALASRASATLAAMETSSDAIYVDEGDHYNDDWAPPFDFRDTVRIRTNQKFSDFYTLYEEIGEGKFGKVFRCVENATGLELAAKCIRLKKDADLAKVEKEVNIMTQMRHKCIAQIYDAFANSANEIVLIMEIVSGGELFDRVVDESYILTETAVAMIVYQICEAVRYIHSQKILHLDLKPENIMCCSLTGNQIKLIDFGLAQFYDGQADLLFMAGTPEFAAPEVIKYEPLDFHTDMWSLGVITYILLSGQSPFLGDNIALTYCNVEKGNWSFCEEFDENGISEEARDFISKLLIVDKSKRMLPDECLRHAWIQNCLERARSKTKEKTLNVAKLRSYVKNKRFRRAVFGVIFVNQAVRMMSLLQTKKSEHGVQYMQDMLNATATATAANAESASVGGGANPAAAQLLKSAFAKRRRNATGEPPPSKANVASSKAEDASAAADAEKPSTSRDAAPEGRELHARAKRSNHHATPDADEIAATAATAVVVEASATINLQQHAAAAKPTKDALCVPAEDAAAATASGSSPEASRTASPKLIKRQRDKANRTNKSSTSRKASSSEQAAKKPKQGSGSGGLTSKILLETATEKPDPELHVESKAGAPTHPEKKSESMGKPSTKVGGILAKFQQQQQQQSNEPQNAGFSLPVACVLPMASAPKKQSSDVEMTPIIAKPENKANEESTKAGTESTTAAEKPKKLFKKKKAADSTAPKKPKSNSTAGETDAKQSSSAKTAALDLKSIISNLNSTSSAKAAESAQKPDKAQAQRKSADSLLSDDAGKSERRASVAQKPGGLVGSLLQRLERNDAPPMVMAVSSFVPPPRVEQATLKGERPKAGKVLKIEKEKHEGDEEEEREKRGVGGVQILAPSLEKKIVSEKKTRVKKRTALKERSAGDEQSATSEREHATRSAVSVAQTTTTTTTSEAATTSLVDAHRVRFEAATLARERDEQRGDGGVASAAASLTSRATLDIASASATRQPKGKARASATGAEGAATASVKERKKQQQLKISDETSARLELDASVDVEKRALKKAALVAEKTRKQRVVAERDGERNGVQSEAMLKLHALKPVDAKPNENGWTTTKKSVAFSTQSLNSGNSESDLYSSSTVTATTSMDDEVAAFKALMARRQQRSLGDLRGGEKRARGAAHQLEMNGNAERRNGSETGNSMRSQLRSYRSLNLDDEENVESLLQAQQDAFDFSVLRSKLESRLSGKPVEEDPTYAENFQHKIQVMEEIRSKLHDTGNIRRAMNKWHEMEKGSAQQK